VGNKSNLSEESSESILHLFHEKHEVVVRLSSILQEWRVSALVIVRHFLTNISHIVTNDDIRYINNVIGISTVSITLLNVVSAIATAEAKPPALLFARAHEQ
jgi:hypothetical protein